MMSSVSIRNFVRAGGVASLAIAVFAAAVTPCHAVIVNYVLGVHDGQPGPPQTTPVNVTAPADDPGWYRVPNPGTNNAGIYMGNQWMLSATHVGVPSEVFLPSGNYPVVPGSVVKLSNPTNTGRSLSTESDIVLYRIGLHPDTHLSPEDEDGNIADDPFGEGLVQLTQSTPSVNTEVTMIGNGVARIVLPENENGHWHSPNDKLHGFNAQVLPNGAREKTWGTNRISPATVVSEPRLDSLRFITEVTGRDIVALGLQFNSTEYTGVARGTGSPTTFEAHAKGGDSGGPVFVKEDVPIDPGNPTGATTEQWRLAGVLHATANITVSGDSRSPRHAVFGDVTIFSDLSNQHYRDQIDALLADDFAAFESISGLATGLEGYGLQGDITLDGEIDADDVNAFVAGWGYSQAEADIYSWSNGDLNLDGKTDAFDFVLLNAALPSTSTVSLASLGVGPIPEPGAAILLAAVVPPLALRRRK